MEAPNRFVLIGYLEEALPAEQMAKVEDHLRKSSEWRAALSELHGEIDPGEHSIATIWRRHRLTCLSRERLGAYLIDAVPPDESDYIRFHLEIVACRWCQANRADLKAAGVGQPAHDKDTARRRKKFFQTSVGSLPKKR